MYSKTNQEYNEQMMSIPEHFKEWAPDKKEL